MKSWLPNSYDIYLFHQGNHFRSYQLLGAHFAQREGVAGVRFALWAPDARKVELVGDFNGWQGEGHSMEPLGGSGIWHIFVPGLQHGELYKYQVFSMDGQIALKSDPYGFWAEKRPQTASRIFQLEGYQWQDEAWQAARQYQCHARKPIAIYEVHLGSWRRKDNGEFLTYRELAEPLINYLLDLGYTHVEFLPVMEHPLDASWGYQLTGYYAATSRYGTPLDLMYLIDQCHQAGIGVILDWVPGHFCRDSHGLRELGGTSLFESHNHTLSNNQQWGTQNFDYSKPEVRSFLISNAIFWLEVFHADGLRVDAVSSMLYLDYGKKQGQWEPNIYGGRENLAAISFLKKLNQVVAQYNPGALMIAEDSSSWPQVTGSIHLGGLGFSYKWNMGWMNDMLKYMEMDPVHRKWHHHLLTFSLMYAFTENYLLPLSHDEVVHEKKSLLSKMPGDSWQKFAGLRCFYSYMMAHPGKKLLFMGGELGQEREWHQDRELDWQLLEWERHRQLVGFMRELQGFYRQEAALWELDNDWAGFQWVDANNYQQSIVSFIRKGQGQDNFLVVVSNFTPKVYHRYLVGVPRPGQYEEAFNSDWQHYGGAGYRNENLIVALEKNWQSQPYAVELTIPPLATVFLRSISK
ncbi:MAG: 1,4-alpha-glucan branching protein GlgB [Bacillota bacterium]|nr:1,4-alpha-glucan branching protein GlgB [Bacillota bacterium]